MTGYPLGKVSEESWNALTYKGLSQDTRDSWKSIRGILGYSDIDRIIPGYSETGDPLGKVSEESWDTLGQGTPWKSIRGILGYSDIDRIIPGCSVTGDPLGKVSTESWDTLTGDPLSGVFEMRTSFMVILQKIKLLVLIIF